MTSRRLIIGGSWPRGRPLTTHEFLWRAASDETSFRTRLGPQLAAIGEVPEPNVDLVALAVLTFLADRTIRRPSKGWEREIELDLPVFDVDGWQAIAPDVARTLEVLTADTWTLDFRKRAAAKPQKVAERPKIDRVLLFSGGADSLCGAVRSLAAGERLLLVSHWDWAGHSPYQQRLANGWPDGSPTRSSFGSTGSGAVPPSLAAGRSATSRRAEAAASCSLRSVLLTPPLSLAFPSGWPRTATPP